ncbi:hemerythrin domain-containing protein [Allopusillimonas ginsengisoli]|uniref:hemerythrin domain-containing protein n=1 Tax=Allopusillimonas ginsengisoli TaxID=453575 RepID=UPI00101FBD97|nr:hemerythrin domain-containing protein [Allopusillimonas ginsengisoli]TEA78005.1 hemerythrin domain-containing protein [Allopusillimonas ginsengisoli]
MSSTAFPGFSGPAASTEAPLEMLAACHVRIERYCATLSRLSGHALEQGSDADAQRAAAGIIRYFDTAAVLHHADEEEDLFPALLESMAGSDAVCIRELTSALSAEHRLLESAWRTLRASLQRIAAGKPALLPDAAVITFTSTYARHMRIEEDEVLPMAARLLSDHDIDRIGRAMRKRRGISDDLI